MPGRDLARRDEFERQLARALGRINAETRREILELIGDPPSLARLTPEVWEQIEARYGAAISSILDDVFRAAVEQWMATRGVGVMLSWDLVNQRAVDWAYQYTYDLVRGMTNTTRQTLARAIEHYYQGRLDLPGVAKRISAAFGPERASTIAVTEITRAAVQGQNWYQDELEGMGIKTVRVWQTANDEHTCPLCAPNHGKRETDGWTVPEPPAHPNCRCWLTIEPVIPE